MRGSTTPVVMLVVTSSLVLAYAADKADKQSGTQAPAAPGAAGEIQTKASARSSSNKRPAGTVPDTGQAGGEPQGIVQVGNLIYAGTKTSKCFSDHFLKRAARDSSISTSGHLHAVKLAENELFSYPLVIMTGEGAFNLTDRERDNLRRFLERGGMLLASAGCSSADWDRSFRREMSAVFPQQPMQPLSMDHPIFHTVYDIGELRAKHGQPKPLEGIRIENRIAVLYSQDGLNDTSHAWGCCCCGGNEITNSIDVNVNILAYALTH